MPLVYISNIERNDPMLFILEKNIFLKHIKLDEISQDADILMRLKQDSMMYVCIKIEEQHVISWHFKFCSEQFNIFNFRKVYIDFREIYILKISKIDKN